MTFNTASFESVLTTILAILFALAGVINLARRGAVKRDFARWGYPTWFPLLCGALELLSAALLLDPRTKTLGLTLSGAIMLAALFTLFRNREPFKHLAPALAFAALVVATAAFRG